MSGYITSSAKVGGTTAATIPFYHNSARHVMNGAITLRPLTETQYAEVLESVADASGAIDEAELDAAIFAKQQEIQATRVAKNGLSKMAKRTKYIPLEVMA
jgi:hypothetical protein